jgi:DNA polymerase III subunit gamma/tau
MAGRALYLSWRPRTFDDVVGQRHIVQTLRNAVRQGALAHAYLFSGPRGTGKTSLARLLFKAVNCLQPEEGAPDERCAICVSANEGRAIDLIEMDAASNRGIDDVRDLRDKINYAPAEARYRVYILDEAHQLTQPAWDALLKTLEEPPPHAILVLATTEAHKVPATVLSRCQRFDFHRISAVDIRDRLAAIARREGLDVDPTVLSWLARAARGGLRDAISLLDQLRAFSGDRIDAESAREVLGLAGLETVRPFLEALRDDRPGDALEELNDALERGADLRMYAADALAYLRALLLLRYGAGTSLRAEFPAEEVAWLEEQATEWEAPRLRALVGGFGDALARFRDPAQLLVQVELVLLAGWDEPVGAAREPPPPRRPARVGTRPPEPPSAAPTSTPLAADVAHPSTNPANASAPAPVEAGGTPALPGSSGHDPPRLAVAAPVEAPTPNGADSSQPPTADEPLPALAAAAVLEATVSVAASEGARDHPDLDPTDVRGRWAEIQAQIANMPGRWWFHECGLHDVDGNTLVLRLGAGARHFLKDRDRRLPVERELARALGRPVSVRMADEAVHTASPENAGSSPARPPTEDPVVRAGLRLFGGPLEPLADDG